jgi:hypothetical protein
MSLGWVAMQAAAAADHRMLAADALQRTAAAAGLPLVARLVGVVEVGAAGALQQIAGGRRLVAQLARSAGEQRARQHAVVAPDAIVGGEVGVANQGADAQAAIGRRLDLVEREAVDVDEVGRRFDLQLHQVEQVGAAGDELGVRVARDRCGGVGRRARTLVGERLHVRLPATSVIASTMFE